MLIFDFDGVLHDSRERAWRAYQSVRVSMGLHELPDLTSPDDLPLIYQGVLSRSLTRWIPYETAEEFWRRHAHLTALTAPEETCGVIPELVAVLTELGNGPGYGIVTGSHRDTVEDLLRRELAPGAMPRVLLSRDDKGSKTDKLRHLRHQYGARAYVGDTGSDVRHARAAGFLAIAVLYGYAAEEDLAEAIPDTVITTPAELATWCRAMTGAASSASSDGTGPDACDDR
ncbi:HAD family hydrolase [Streptomyces sp. NPDC054835]|uniref:HAD family hydrolase n=1 Tax=Streptomyces exfoliatus TaxID=1905 RepID=UPI000465CBA2|nr:HAD hydrolase-like protein [Streptomyces exfoliatus]